MKSQNVTLHRSGTQIRQYGTGWLSILRNNKVFFPNSVSRQTVEQHAAEWKTYLSTYVIISLYHFSLLGTYMIYSANLEHYILSYLPFININCLFNFF